MEFTELQQFLIDKKFVYVQDLRKQLECSSARARAVRDALAQKIWSVYEAEGYTLNRAQKRVRDADGKIVAWL